MLDFCLFVCWGFLLSEESSFFLEIVPRNIWVVFFVKRNKFMLFRFYSNFFI